MHKMKARPQTAPLDLTFDPATKVKDAYDFTKMHDKLVKRKRDDVSADRGRGRNNALLDHDTTLAEKLRYFNSNKND